MFDYLRYGWDFYHLGNFLDNEVVRALLLGSLIAALIVYFAFLSRRNSDRFTGFTGWIYEFLNFNRLILEGIFKILYLLITFFYVSAYVYIILHEDSNLMVNFIALIVGVVAIRIGYEFVLMVIMLCRNVSDINMKMKMDQNSKQNISYRNYSNPENRNIDPDAPNMNRNTEYTNGNIQNGLGNQMGNSFVQPPLDRQASNASVRPQQSDGQHVNAHQSSALVNNMYNHQLENVTDKMNDEQAINTEENTIAQETGSKKSVESFTEPLPIIQNVKYCNVCGNVLEAEDVFCANCGKRVE
ncbi:MAG TPA: zinc ribbon domain-containing protein [Lachnospiraceae bacterium]|nr:zinc ribbon domain-containing protein [Lachnospiraceae bacterium]